MITADKDYYGLSKLDSACGIEKQPTDTQVRVGVLNLMEDKQSSEAPWFMVMSSVTQNLHISFLRLAGYDEQSKHRKYVDIYYDEATSERLDNLDALVMTGLPAGGFAHPFLDFANWDELSAVFDMAKSKGIPILGSCWAGYALLFHRHGVLAEKYAQKRLGLFHQSAFTNASKLRTTPYLPSFMSVARRLTVPTDAVADIPDVDVHWGNDETGIFLATDRATRDVFIHSHVECGYGYARAEYESDIRNKVDFVAGDHPIVSAEGEQAAKVWQASGHQLLRDWIVWVAAENA